MKTNNWKLRSSLWLLVAGLLFTVACSDDVEAPEEENEVEEFTNIEFIFTNINDASDVSRGIWEDEDGFGPLEPVIIQHPTLKAGETYELTFIMENRLVTPVEDVMDEIMDEDDEHQIFFAFDDNLFSDPTGTGNIRDEVNNRTDNDINYLDFDDNGLPLGLITRWTTVEEARTDGKFRAVLAHKPGLKTETSTWNADDIDWDITFDLTIVVE
ncbi:MAG: hypothetical protein LAT68_04455 [Cyclobacteriaceae bacterium]|nr:hypothetical protein [Cyclobacteriaceae bacterium]MCH8515561.1 hypothetical protein [Cyclobacteriaceae bacterium]